MAGLFDDLSAGKYRQAARGLLGPAYEPLAALPGLLGEFSPGADVRDYQDYGSTAIQKALRGDYGQAGLDALWSAAALAGTVLPGSVSGYRKLADELPMDEASRMARAQEMGFDVDTPMYHGTTHDFPSFGGEKGNVEGHFGAGHYFTSSPADASKNYAGVGPDLTQRIEIRAERLADELQDFYDASGSDVKGVAALKKKWGKDVYDEDTLKMARNIAAKELKGESEAVVLPVLLRGKTVDVRNHTRGRPTTLEFDLPSPDDFMDDAKDYLGPSATKDEIYDAAVEMADEAFATTEPTGTLADFSDYIRRAANDYGYDADAVLAPIYEHMYDGISASDLDRYLRHGPLQYAEDPKTGALAVGDVIRKAFQAAGFENILMDAESAFPNMPNIRKGTTHIVTSSPANIRSRFAKFDPAKKDSGNILAGAAGLGLLAPVGAYGISGLLQTDDGT